MLRRFFFDLRGPVVLVGLTDIETDRELQARNEARARELAAQMGQKYVLHPSNQPKKVRRES